MFWRARAAIIITDFFPERFASCEDGARGDEPAVADAPLVGVVRGGPVHEEPRRLAQVLKTKLDIRHHKLGFYAKCCLPRQLTV